MWLCPLCKSAISLHSKAIKCENNHSFDKAKSGYVNLLPVQFKKSKVPGDDKAMVKARREFHELNAYKPLKDRLVQRLAQHLAPSNDTASPVAVYDTGCGEGSYLDAVINGLKQLGYNCSGAGSDISKIAVEIASKAFKTHQFVVASSFDLPLEDASQDVMIQVFAPGSNNEYVRALKCDGLLLTVDPGADHLYEIKSQIYDNPKKHESKDTQRENLRALLSERLTFPIALTSKAHALALIKMTPFYWKLPQGRIDDIVEALSVVTADFHIQLWQKAE